MSGIDETHDPALTSWVPGADGHPDFPVQNLPLGIFSPLDAPPRAGTAIGDHILDLAAIAPLLPASIRDALEGTTLNALFALPPSDRVDLRRALSLLLSVDTHRSVVEAGLHEAAGCELHLPMAIGDYTDFYVGIHHATNIGMLLRPDNPLLPNYKHVPIGYHGRASSVRPSGTAVRRPMGQRKAPDADAPVLLPTARLDYELELGVWIAGGNMLGEPIPIAQAGAHVAGLCLLNDWSARDVQAWEYQPLGPFLAKNFLSTVSPWIVTVEALAPFRIAQPPRPEGDPHPLPYLWSEEDQRGGGFALTLEASISTARMREGGIAPHRLSRGPSSSMYWTIAQMIAHHTVGGCDLRSGDLLGTGTISAERDDGQGSMMELSRGGRSPVALPGGEVRTFLEDGDEILLSARAAADGFVPIGFGTCRGEVTAAR